MKTIELQQGTPEWKEWRASRFTASDAPAMLGISPYKTRAELLREKATGETKEYNEATRARFAAGHYAEEKAREMMEAQIGEELFPCVGEDDYGRLAASFDGMTMTGDVIFEHKLLNNDLRRCRDEGAELPEHYRAQMEHQLLVSGARECIFVASKWDGNGELEEEPLQVSYFPNNAMRARILDGWKQFSSDLKRWQPDTAAPAPEGSAHETLPALHVEVRGQVIASNLTAFREQALSVIGNINSVTGRIAKAEAEQAAREEAQRQAAEAEAQAQAQAPAMQEWEPLSVRAINKVIAPLSITTAGLEYFGCHSVETKDRAVLYPACVIEPLCLAAAQHLQNVAKAHKV